MADPRTVQRCRWAEPTLFVAEPIWTEAEQYPWTCRAEGPPHVVEDTTLCATCGRWVPRDAVCDEAKGCTCPGPVKPFARR
jgi:hypothetical protein